MGNQPYSKPPLLVIDQIKLLKTRGLQIPDEEEASRYLHNISYFRLSGYMYPFLKDKKQHQYKDNTFFEDILNLYRFDRELRQLVFSSIEKIEIAIRSQIANHYSVSLTSPFWYAKPENFSEPLEYSQFINNISQNINRSNDIFVKHFFKIYNGPHLPIWVLLEILSIGQLSYLYSITTKSPPKKAVADYFGIKAPVLSNWLHTLVYVRNTCAHHSRLWNKELSIQIKKPRKTSRLWLSSLNISDRKIYVILAVITYLLDAITPNNTFRKKIDSLILKYPTVDTSAMGFPKDWKDDPFWSCASKPLGAQV